MSLRDAVEEIVTEMEAEDCWKQVLSPYIKMFRMALKASKDEVQHSPSNIVIPGENAVLKKQLEVQRKRVERDAEEAQIDLKRDHFGLQMVELREDPDVTDGVWDQVQGDPMMPVGAFSPFNGKVFQKKKDGHLYYHPEQTARYQNQMSGSSPG